MQTENTLVPLLGHYLIQRNNDTRVTGKGYFKASFQFLVRMMNMKKNVIMINMLVMLLFVFVPIHANDQESADFNVEAIRHEKQLNPKVGYYHLLAKEDLLNHPLQLKVSNNSDQDEEYEVSFSVAKTNRKGVIVYDDRGFGPNTSIQYHLEDYVNIDHPRKVIPAHSFEIFTAQVDTRSLRDIQGILMGAFKVSKTRDFKQEEGIGNRFSYELGLVITDDASASLPNSQRLELNEDSVQLKLEGIRKIVEYEIDNLEPQIARNLHIEAKLVDEKNNKTVLQRVDDGYSIAPNGVLKHFLDWQRFDVKSGDYKLIVTAADGNNIWEWEKNLTIQADEAKQINKASPYRVKVPKQTPMIVVVLLFVTIMNHYKLAKRKED